MMYVRAATSADAAALAAFARRVFHDTFARDNTPEDMALYLDATFTPERQAAELGAPENVFLLAEMGDDATERTLVGYAHLASSAAPTTVAGPAPMKLRRFYVDAAWHGRGVAATLMGAALDTARDRGARTLWLCVWERNARAIAFYAKLGFRDVGAQPFVLGSEVQTDRVMARPV